MQKFHKFDHVMIAKDLGSTMSHFIADEEAIVIGSYKDKYGGNDDKSYILHIKGHGEVSWYYEHQLVLIKSGQESLLKEWDDEEKADAKIKSDIDWIFANGKEVLKKGHGVSIGSLAKQMGINLWGNHGEGVDWYINAMTVMKFSKPYLEKGDKEGWLKAVAALKK